MQRIENQLKEKKKRNYSQIDDMQLILKEIYKEQKNQNEIIVSFKYYLEIEVPKIVEKMKK